MKYGHFDDSRREYVITTPRTPLPWINYLGTGISLRCSATQPAGTVFFGTRACAGSRVTVITTALWTRKASTFI